MTRSRRRWKPLPPDRLVREGWFLAILLAERLPRYATTPANLAMCKVLAERFAIEHAAEIDAVIAGVKAKLGDAADLDDFVGAVLAVLVPWERAASDIAFSDREPAPYR